MRESGEIIFVDATSNCDSQNMAIMPILCVSPSGALPLAFLFMSSQEECMFTRGIINLYLCYELFLTPITTPMNFLINTLRSLYYEANNNS